MSNSNTNSNSNNLSAISQSFADGVTQEPLSGGSSLAKSHPAEQIPDDIKSDAFLYKGGKLYLSESEQTN